jgi:hypothetical protein
LEKVEGCDYDLNLFSILCVDDSRRFLLTNKSLQYIQNFVFCIIEKRVEMGAILSRFFASESDPNSQKDKFNDFLQNLQSEVLELRHDMNKAGCEGTVGCDRNQFRVSKYVSSYMGDTNFTTYFVEHDETKEHITLLEHGGYEHVPEYEGHSYPTKLVEKLRIVLATEKLNERGMKAMTGHLTRVLMGRLNPLDVELLKNKSRTGIANQPPVVE